MNRDWDEPDNYYGKDDSDLEDFYADEGFGEEESRCEDCGLVDWDDSFGPGLCPDCGSDHVTYL